MRNWIRNARAKVSRKTFFHLHLISDATGETLIMAGRAAAAQYNDWHAVEHVTPMVRTKEQVLKALEEVDKTPGVVLYTLMDRELSKVLTSRCVELGVPAVDVLSPVMNVFEGYLGQKASGQMGAQHAMDENYFGRLDALQFAMTHDDGNLPDDVESCDIILIGISRTSKTPTSIYLAQRGLRVVNIPLVPGTDLPDSVKNCQRPQVVALVASTERILQVRENRLLAFDRELQGDVYVDRASIQEELKWTRRLCREHNWPMIDVSKRSIEETSAAIIALRPAGAQGDRKLPSIASATPDHD